MFEDLKQFIFIDIIVTHINCVVTSLQINNTLVFLQGLTPEYNRVSRYSNVDNNHDIQSNNYQYSVNLECDDIYFLYLS